jgi:hypothetical protein
VSLRQSHLDFWYRESSGSTQLSQQLRSHKKIAHLAKDDAGFDRAIALQTPKSLQ